MADSNVDFISGSESPVTLEGPGIYEYSSTVATGDAVILDLRPVYKYISDNVPLSLSASTAVTVQLTQSADPHDSATWVDSTQLSFGSADCGRLNSPFRGIRVANSSGGNSNVHLLISVRQ